MIVRAAAPESFAWLLARAGGEPTPTMKAIEAVDASGRILGMVAGASWTPASVTVSIAIDDPCAARPLLKAAATWIFEQTDRLTMLAVIREDNTKSLRFAKGAGFREVYRVRDGWRLGIDLVVLEGRREWCKWHRLARKVAA